MSAPRAHTIVRGKTENTFANALHERLNEKGNALTPFLSRPLDLLAVPTDRRPASDELSATQSHARRRLENDRILHARVSKLLRGAGELRAWNVEPGTRGGLDLQRFVQRQVRGWARRSNQPPVAGQFLMAAQPNSGVVEGEQQRGLALDSRH